MKLHLTALSTVLLACAMSASCQPATPQAPHPCPRDPRTLPVRYVGGVLGTGTLELAPAPAGYDVQATLDREGGLPALSLSGTGSCRHGVFEAEFGGGDAPEAQAKVLGGHVEGVWQPARGTGDFFARWSAQLVIKASGERRQLHGFVEHAPGAR
ncbi:MAG: hypothetical protein OXR73_13365 [Myxococcales bacterium]|nr:hypothetical protein [Myxococcales bacterium]